MKQITAAQAEKGKTYKTSKGSTVTCCGPAEKQPGYITMENEAGRKMNVPGTYELTIEDDENGQKIAGIVGIDIIQLSEHISDIGDDELEQLAEADGRLEVMQMVSEEQERRQGGGEKPDEELPPEAGEQNDPISITVENEEEAEGFTEARDLVTGESIDVGGDGGTVKSYSSIEEVNAAFDAGEIDHETKATLLNAFEIAEADTANCPICGREVKLIDSELHGGAKIMVDHRGGDMPLCDGSSRTVEQAQELADQLDALAEETGIGDQKRLDEDDPSVEALAADREEMLGRLTGKVLESRKALKECGDVEVLQEAVRAELGKKKPRGTIVNQLNARINKLGGQKIESLEEAPAAVNQDGDGNDRDGRSAEDPKIEPDAPAEQIEGDRREEDHDVDDSAAETEPMQADGGSDGIDDAKPDGDGEESDDEPGSAKLQEFAGCTFDDREVMINVYVYGGGIPRNLTTAQKMEFVKQADELIEVGEVPKEAKSISFTYFQLPGDVESRETRPPKPDPMEPNYSAMISAMQQLAVALPEFKKAGIHFELKITT